MQLSKTEAGPRSRFRRSLKRQGVLAPGLLLALGVALVAALLAAVTPTPAVLVALVVGMLLSPIGSRSDLGPGLSFAARDVLRVGVALLGAQVTVAQLIALGPAPFLIAVCGVFFALGAGYVLARLLGLSSELSILSAAAVAICGASAAMAVSAVLPKHKQVEEHAATTIAGITVLGTIAMVLYPFATRALALDSTAAGIFLGGTLHEVVQAVGAGFSVSDAAGQTAATVKLARVACLAPVILILGWISHRLSKVTDDARPALLPWFLIAFLLLSGLSSMNLFPEVVLSFFAGASRLCLLVAIAALGTKVSLGKIVRSGPRPLLALVGQSLLIAAFTLTAIFLMRLA